MLCIRAGIYYFLVQPLGLAALWLVALRVSPSQRIASRAGKSTVSCLQTAAL
jgi:hypothetical protein